MPALLCSPFLSVASSTLPCGAHTEASCKSHSGTGHGRYSHMWPETEHWQQTEAVSLTWLFCSSMHSSTAISECCCPDSSKDAKAFPSRMYTYASRHSNLGFFSMVACSNGCWPWQTLQCGWHVVHDNCVAQNSGREQHDPPERHSRRALPAAFHLQQLKRVAVAACAHSIMVAKCGSSPPTSR